AIQRGLVTPDRSTLIASSHRSYAVGEESARGNGIADSNKVIEAGEAAAKRFICVDLQALADQAGSVISASLFGAVAGSGTLPFTREDYEETIRRGGVGVEASLRAFALGFDAAANAPASPARINTEQPQPTVPDTASHPRIRKLLEDLRQNFPAVSQPMLVTGLRRCIDFQDPAYGAKYLDRLRALHKLDEQHGGASRN